MCIYAAEACLYAPRIQCIRLEELEVHTATLSLTEELEVHTSTIARSAYLQKTLLPGSTLPRMEELEVHTSTLPRSRMDVQTPLNISRRARGAYLYAPVHTSSSTYLKASSRCIPLRPPDSGFRIEELEVHTSTLPGGSSARDAYLQKSSLPGELEVHTSTLPGRSRARGVYLQKSSLPGSKKSSRCIPLRS